MKNGGSNRGQSSQMLGALMSTEDSATIQDESTNIWRLSGSDLRVLTDHTGKTVQGIARQRESSCWN